MLYNQKSDIRPKDLAQISMVYHLPHCMAILGYPVLSLSPPQRAMKGHWPSTALLQVKGAYWNHGSFARRTKQQVIHLQQKAATLLLNSRCFCYLCSTAKRGSMPSSKGFCYTASPSWFRRFISSMSASAGSGNQGTCGSWLVWTFCLVLFLVQVSATFEWES